MDLEKITRGQITSEPPSDKASNAIRGEGAVSLPVPKAGEPNPRLIIDLNPENLKTKSLVREVVLDGSVKKYTVEVQTDGGKWTPVGTFDTEETPIAKLDYVPADKVALKFLSPLEEGTKEYLVTAFVKVCNRKCTVLKECSELCVAFLPIKWTVQSYVHIR